LTPGLSFCHNMCYRCPNGPCKPIFDIYISIAFQWYKKHPNARCFWPLQSNSETLGVSEDSQVPISGMWVSSSHSLKVKLRHWQFRDSHLGVPGQKAIWMWASGRGTKYTIRGKVVASPKSGPWWVLWVRICPWLVLAPKVLQLCTNQLVVWFVQTRMSDYVFVILSSLISELQHAPLPPENATNQGACPDSLFFHCLQSGLTFESIKEPRGASRCIITNLIN